MKLLTVNLEEKLIAEKKNQINAANYRLKAERNIVDQANSILKNTSESIENTLIDAGFETAINNAQAVLSTNKSVIKKLESLKNERIFTVQEIKNLALNYGLRFLPTNYYKGDIPTDLSLKIKECEDLYGKPEKRNEKDIYSGRRWWTSSNNVGTNFDYMILAPSSSFELQEKPKDPLLFRRLPDGTFYLVHKWGSDLSIIRFFSYWFKRSRVPYILVALLIYLSLVTVFSTNPTPFIIITLFSTIVSFFAIGYPGISWSIEEYESSWNSPFKS